MSENKKNGTNIEHESVEDNLTTVTVTENWVVDPNGSGKWVPYTRTTQESSRKVAFE